MNDQVKPAKSQSKTIWPKHFFPSSSDEILTGFIRFSSEPGGLFICSYAQGMRFIPSRNFIFVLKQKRSKKFKAVNQMAKIQKDSAKTK
jgi:hypothetical protein